MMFLRSGYFLKRAIRNMRQSPVLSLASTITVAVALALLAFFAIAVLNVQQLSLSWEEDLSIVAYLNDGSQEQDVRGWIDKIEGYPEVESVYYVSHESALGRFRERLGEEAGILDGLPEDILPASLEITLVKEQRNNPGLSAVVAKLRTDYPFADMQYGQEWLEKLEAFLLLLRITGAGIGGFLVLAALIIVSNTIKLTLYARQDELEAMTMVGATSMFIKLPFLMEGALQGVLGGLFALISSFLAFEVVLEKNLGELLLITGIDSIHFLPFSWQVFLIVGGGLVGLMGSLFALRKFVRFSAT